MRILILSIMIVIANLSLAQSMADRFREQQSEIKTPPSSAPLTEILQLWETMRHECRWFHLAPKLPRDGSIGVFSLSDASIDTFGARAPEDWKFRSNETFPVLGLPFFCVYQNAAWGGAYVKNEWRGRKFTCDNDPSKLVESQWDKILAPYVHGKINDNSVFSVALSYNFGRSQIVKPSLTQFELNFEAKTCFFEQHKKIHECKLIEIDRSKLSQQFFKNIAYRINDAVKQCSQ